MSKETLKKATFKDLVAKKLKKDQDRYKTKDIYIKSLDATLTFKKPTDADMIETMNGIGDASDISNIVSEYKKLIYKCCDMLQNTELHKEIEVIDPYDTVEKIFTLQEIFHIGEELESLLGIDDKVEEIKN